MRESEMLCIETGPETLQCDRCAMRMSVEVQECPAHWFFYHLGNKWTTPVLGSLYHGSLRFSQLRKLHAPISERMLILSLRKLEEADFVVRVQTGASPKHSTYEITDVGRSLLEASGDLIRWMRINAADIAQIYSDNTSSSA